MSQHSVCKNGNAKMHRIIQGAPGDIRHRLWSLYWLARLSHTPGGVVIELGTRRGDSTRALLAACEDCGGELYSWDVVDVEATVKEETMRLGIPWFDAPWHFTVNHSVAGGIDWGKPGAVDMVFVDTDHTYRTTQAEINIWTPHVRVGGCVAFHDYWLFDPPRDEHQGRGVKMAVDEWANHHSETWRLETHDAGPEGDTGFAILWSLG